MRLFVALELNSKVVAGLTELVRRLRPYAPIRWVNPQHMHVTLKYIGEWTPQRLDKVIHALGEAKIDVALSVQLAGLGFFPDLRSPRVFWVGAENTPLLRRLASAVDASLQPLAIAPEVRPYQPHLSLGRIPQDTALEDLHHAIEELPTREFGTISPDHFVLFESTLTNSGPIYRKIAEFPFVSQPNERAAAHRALYAGRY